MRDGRMAGISGFVMEPCPKCGVNVKRMATDPPVDQELGCSSCQQTAAENARGIQATREQAPMMVTDGAFAALQRNHNALTSTVSRLDAKVLALSGDVADLRRELQAYAAVGQG